MEVPEVPAFRAPPPPSTASRTIEGGSAQLLLSAIETLGDSLCRRMEQTLERTVDAAFERNFTAAGSKVEQMLERTVDTEFERDFKAASGKATCNDCPCSAKPRAETPLASPLLTTARLASPSLTTAPSMEVAMEESSGDGKELQRESRSPRSDCKACECTFKQLRFDEVKPMGSNASQESTDEQCMVGQLSADVWPEPVGDGSAVSKPKNSMADGLRWPGDRPPNRDFHRKKNSRDERLKVDIRVSFKEIEGGTGLSSYGVSIRASTLEDKEGHPCLQRLVLHPASNPILVWHIIGPILLIYDVVMIPMHAFPLPQILAFQIMAGIVTSYWTLDAIRNFLTGYETDKAVEMRPGKIAWKYIRGWFVLDVISCTMDWVFFIMGNRGSFSKLGRTVRAIHAWRLLRLLRLVRVLKFAKKINSFANDMITSLQGLITLKSLYVGIFVCFACHYMACYWYLVGDLQALQRSDRSWLREYNLIDSPLLEVYVSCFHWAIGQSGFTPTDIHPTNTMERLYACYTSFAWLIMLSVTINLFSIWLGHLHEANKDWEKQNIHLRRFLEEHEVSRSLTARVLRFFRSNYSTHQRRVHEEDVEFLRDIPVPLKICLRREVFFPVLRKHPFFTFIGQVNSTLPVMITYCAMHEERRLAGEIIFVEDTPAQHTLFVLKGRLDYYAVQSAMGVTKLQAGDWALEPALWLHWICRGRLVTEIASELVMVNVEKFMAIMHHARAKGEDIESIRLFAQNVCDHFYNTCSATDLWWDPQGVQTIGDRIQAARSTAVRCSGLTSASLPSK